MCKRLTKAWEIEVCLGKVLQWRDEISYLIHSRKWGDTYVERSI